MTDTIVALSAQENINCEENLFYEKMSKPLKYPDLQELLRKTGFSKK